MPNCPQCSTRHEPEDRYCPKCGQRVASDSADQPMSTMVAMNVSDVQYNLGKVYFKKGDYHRAVETWEKVLKGRPDDAELKALIQDARSRHKASEAAS